MKYTLTISEEHAAVLARACDCYTRLLMGQLAYVADHAMKEMGRQIDNIVALRDGMEKLGPLITGMPLHASKGIFHPELHHDAKVAHDIEAVVTHRLAWDRSPGGGDGVQFYDPIQAADIPLPTIEHRIAVKH